MYGIPRGTAYIPYMDGQYMKLNDCIVDDIFYKSYDSIHKLEQTIETQVKIFSTDVEIVDEFPTATLGNYSILDLLEEVQDRL